MNRSSSVTRCTRGVAASLLLATGILACAPDAAQWPEGLAVQDLAVLRELGGADSFGTLVEVHVTVDGHIGLADRTPVGGNERLLLVDETNGDILWRAGPFGEGPGDIGDTLSIFDPPGADGQVSLYDNLNRRISVFAVAEGDVHAVTTLNYEDGGPVTQAAWLSEDEVVVSGRFEDHWLRFLSVDRSTRTLTETGRVGTAPAGDVSGPEARFLNWTTMTVSPDRQKVALAFLYPSRVVLIDTSTRRYTEVETPISIEPRILSDGVSVRPDIRGGARLSYVDVASTSEYVYALFSGTPRPRWGFGQQVHVFNWDGELVGALRLAERVNHFAVSATTNQVYGIRYDPDSVLFEFERPDVSMFDGRASSTPRVAHR
ncbi:MAG: hypothetical protein PVI01_04380 [Gemmatimonadales bacterium]